MALAKFDLDDLPAHTAGWGPAPLVGDDHVTFQQFNKADRIGRVADWLGVDRFFRRGERYNFPLE